MIQSKKNFTQPKFRPMTSFWWRHTQIPYYPKMVFVIKVLKQIQSTSNLDRSYISLRSMISEILVKIPRRDDIWRQMTPFFIFQNAFHHKNSETYPINSKFGQELHISKRNDFWNFCQNATSWRHLTSFSKFWWRHHQKWWRQQNWAKDKCIIL